MVHVFFSISTLGQTKSPIFSFMLHVLFNESILLLFFIVSIKFSTLSKACLSLALRSLE